MIKALAYTAGGVFLVSLIGAALADRDTGQAPAVEQVHSGASEQTIHPTTGADNARAPFIGAALNLYHTDQLDLYLRAIDQIADTGFSAVQIVTPMFQTDGASPGVGVEVGPDRGPSPEAIAALLRHAKARGLATMLMPQVNFTDPRGNEWRGKLQPEQWGPWWASYRQTIDRFLDIAIENDVDVFVVGCELLTTHKPEHQDRWRGIIDQARTRYNGLLTYSTTWDTYHKVGFWDHLDAIGVSGYWDLTTLAADPQHPTPDALQARWHEIKQSLLAFAQSRGKPVLLTEVGYPSLPWALKDPWNYVNSQNAPADHDAQAAGYRAFISAWNGAIAPPGSAILGDSRAWGVFFHKWDPYHQGGPDDTGYGMAGKPALGLVRDWLHGRLPNNPPRAR